MEKIDHNVNSQGRNYEACSLRISKNVVTSVSGTESSDEPTSMEKSSSKLNNGIGYKFNFQDMKSTKNVDVGESMYKKFNDGVQKPKQRFNIFARDYDFSDPLQNFDQGSINTCLNKEQDMDPSGSCTNQVPLVKAASSFNLMYSISSDDMDEDDDDAELIHNTRYENGYIELSNSPMKQISFFAESSTKYSENTSRKTSHNTLDKVDGNDNVCLAAVNPKTRTAAIPEDDHQSEEIDLGFGTYIIHKKCVEPTITCAYSFTSDDTDDADHQDMPMRKRSSKHDESDNSNVREDEITYEDVIRMIFPKLVKRLPLAEKIKNKNPHNGELKSLEVKVSLDKRCTTEEGIGEDTKLGFGKWTVHHPRFEDSSSMEFVYSLNPEHGAPSQQVGSDRGSEAPVNDDYLCATRKPLELKFTLDDNTCAMTSFQKNNTGFGKWTVHRRIDDTSSSDFFYTVCSEYKKNVTDDDFSHPALYHAGENNASRSFPYSSLSESLDSEDAVTDERDDSAECAGGGVFVLEPDQREEVEEAGSKTDVTSIRMKQRSNKPANAGALKKLQQVRREPFRERGMLEAPMMHDVKRNATPETGHDEDEGRAPLIHDERELSLQIINKAVVLDTHRKHHYSTENGLHEHFTDSEYLGSNSDLEGLKILPDSPRKSPKLCSPQNTHRTEREACFFERDSCPLITTSFSSFEKDSFPLLMHKF